MKKILSVFLSLMLVLSGIVLPDGVQILNLNTKSVAAAEQETLWTYEAYEYGGVSGIALTGYKGTQTDIYVPNKLTVDGTSYTVLKLGDGIFKDNTAVNSITLADGIKEIGANAFSGATNLVCIVTNEDLEKIGANAFNGCTSFNSIIIYDAVTSIGENAFGGCSALTIYCNENNTGHTYAVANSIKYKFLNADAEPEIYTVDGITYYIMNGEAYAVSCEAGLTDVVIPTVIKGYPVTGIKTTFKNCTTLISIELPSGLKILDEGAFYGCESLTSINIPEAVTFIDYSAFVGCTSLEAVNISDIAAWCNISFASYYSNPLYLAHKLYLNDELVTKLIIPDGITSIGNDAFIGGSCFESVSIPDSVTYIGYDAFYHCTSLDAVYISDISAWCNISFDRYSSNPLNYAQNLYLNNELVTNLIIPDEVTSIEKYAFWGGSCLESIYMPDSVTYIGDSAFYGCTGITDVVISNSITIINYAVFYGCTGIRNIVIPNGVTSIGISAFAQCKGLEEITLPDGVTSIGEYAFANCTELTKIEIPDSVTSIGGYAFNGCTSLEDVVLPSGITVIPEYLFSGCSKLDNIEIPSSVTTIERYAFYGCKSLEEITVPNSVTSIGMGIFQSCTGLTNVILSDNITNIGSSMFSGCTGLTDFEIPDGVTSIDSGAFSGCTGLTDIEIPDSVTTIGNDAFQRCTGLTSIVVPDSVTSLGTYVFNGCSNIESVTLPNSLTSVGDYLFGSCSSLKSIVIPDTVTSIGKYTFYYCSSLKDVTLSTNIKSIDEYAFSYCEELESITLPDGMTSIGNNAFYVCPALTKVVIPDTVTSIGSKAFEGSQYVTLEVYEDSYAHSYAVNNGIAYTFIEEESESGIYVVDDITYQITDGEATAISYVEGITDVVIPSTVKGYPVTGVGTAFRDCKTLTSITLPDSITKIDESAFYGCWYLTNIEIPDSVVSIGAKAFYLCYNLTTVDIPKDITVINEETFANCNALDNIILPDGITTIDTRAFYGCRGLKNITIPGNVTIGYCAFNYCAAMESVTFLGKASIGSGAFGSCDSLKAVHIKSLADWRDTSFVDLGSNPLNIAGNLYLNGELVTDLVIPEDETYIYYTFSGCKSIERVTVPANLRIGTRAFYNCSGIKNVLIEDGVKYIGVSAFEGCTGLLTVLVPESVTSIQSNAFNATTILLVYENSYAHQWAIDNGYLYFVMHKTSNPEISYGSGISGTVTYTDGSAAEGATVDIIYDDGTVKESVITDENSAYSFTYAEVGRYTIKVTDSNDKTDSEQVSVKRMNVFDVFLAGETDLVLKNSYTVSGSTQSGAVVTITDTDGNIITSATADGGTFAFNDISNGSYIIKAETDTGIAIEEITVFNADVTGITLEIASDTASIVGYVEVEERDFTRKKRNWVQVTLYNEDGTAVASCKTDSDGKYTFAKLPLGEYAIVAEVSEMRPDHHHDFHRGFTLTGYAYVNAEAAQTYTADTIILTEENDNLAEISGKVTAQGENQACEVTLRSVFRHEIASCTTGNNGKYTFVNVRDGLYFITAVTESDGMGFTVVTVRHGKVYGETDIFVRKSDRIHEHEKNMNYIPKCSNRDEAYKHRDKIIAEKKFYDGLSEKEKREFSKEYIDRLNHLAELLASCEYETGDAVLENGGMIISGDELEDDKTVKFTLTVEDGAECEIGSDGIVSDEKYIQQSINDTAGDKKIAKYYDISLKKNVNGVDYKITKIAKDTDTTGKLRITLPIPEEYKGYKHYTFIHVHKGVTQTLIDLDDDPDTMTFEIDRFSTFALACSNEEVAQEGVNVSSSIVDQKTFLEANTTGVKLSVSNSSDVTVQGLAVKYGEVTKELATQITGLGSVLIGAFIPGMVEVTDSTFEITVTE